MYKEEFTIDKKCFVFFNFRSLSCIFGKMKLFKFDFFINCINNDLTTEMYELIQLNKVLFTLSKLLITNK